MRLCLSLSVSGRYADELLVGVREIVRGIAQLDAALAAQGHPDDQSRGVVTVTVTHADGTVVMRSPAAGVLRGTEVGISADAVAAGYRHPHPSVA